MAPKILDIARRAKLPSHACQCGRSQLSIEGDVALLRNGDPPSHVGLNEAREFDAAIAHRFLLQGAYARRNFWTFDDPLDLGGEFCRNGRHEQATPTRQIGELKAGLFEGRYLWLLIST